MMKKLLALALAGAMTFGVAAAGTTGPDLTPIDPDCSPYCSPWLVMPNGVVCELAGCLIGGSQVFCAYNCFYPLPPHPTF